MLWLHAYGKYISLSFSYQIPTDTHRHTCFSNTFTSAPRSKINNLFLLNVLTWRFELLIFMKCSNWCSRTLPPPGKNIAQMFIRHSWWLFLEMPFTDSTACSLFSRARTVNSNPIIAGPCYYGCSPSAKTETPPWWLGLEKRNPFSDFFLAEKRLKNPRKKSILKDRNPVFWFCFPSNSHKWQIVRIAQNGQQ